MIVLTVAVIIAIGVISGRSSKGFATARGQAGAWIVTGAIIGTLVGGQATIGTAEMGYNFGFSGIWFTWGSALGCLLLYFMSKRLRDSGCSTLLELVGKEFGKKAEVTGSLLSLFGMFFSIVAQQLACAALIRAIVPCSLFVALLAGTVMMLVYVVGGGMVGAGKGGVAKLILLYGASIVCGAVVMWRTHGLGDIDPALFNPFNRGLSVDLNSALSMILGVVATQSYAQAVWAGRSTAVARRGRVAQCGAHTAHRRCVHPCGHVHALFASARTCQHGISRVCLAVPASLAWWNCSGHAAHHRHWRSHGNSLGQQHYRGARSHAASA
ncbi:MAG: hypothetical protein KBT13_10210 [Bacteroidales bacterium]|nr:hypothetical protein [Candidatus Sodaliphilus limicaballi]